MLTHDALGAYERLTRFAQIFRFLLWVHEAKLFSEVLICLLGTKTVGALLPGLVGAGSATGVARASCSANDASDRVVLLVVYVVYMPELIEIQI